jgi:hypothetical protein
VTARAAGAGWVAVVACLAAALALALAGGGPLAPPLTVGPVAMVYATTGAVLGLRLRRGHPIGGIYLAVSVVISISLLGEEYARTAFRSPGDHPAATVVAVIANLLQGPIMIGLLVGMLLIFPEGHLPSRQWRHAARAAAAATAGALVAGVVVPGTLPTAPIQNPLAVHGIVARVASVTQALSYLALVGLFVLAASSIVARFRHATGVRRQQLKWLVAAAGFMAFTWICAIPLWIISAGWSDVVWTALFVVGVSTIPIATGFAILRYRLYDIDVIIRRTVAYALLVVVLAAVYLVGVAGLGAVLRSVTGASGALAVTLTTLAVAAAFQPVRARTQRTVDRRFARDRYDAEQALAGLTARLRDGVELEAIRSDVLALVDSTVRPRSASLWLRAVTVPERPPGTTEVS